MVIKFDEKVGDGGLVNGGFFVLSPKCISYIHDDFTIWENDPLQNLAKENQLNSFFHRGFWQSMDTSRDKNILQNYCVKQSSLEIMGLITEKFSLVWGWQHKTLCFYIF